MVLYAVFPVLFVGMYFFGNLYSAVELLDPYNISILAGAAAYVVFMSQFLLSARLKFMERRVPQDRLLALHGTAGMASVSLILIHSVIKFYMVVLFGGPTLQSSLGLIALLASAVLTPLAYFVLRGRRPKRGGSPAYNKHRIAHNIFAAAGLLAVVHVLLATSTWSWSLRGFTALWGMLCLGAYVRHKLLRPRQRTELQLSTVDTASPGVSRIVLDGQLPRRSGQFAYISFQSDIPGNEEHPFTVSSPSGTNVEFTIKGLGDFSSAVSKAPVGTKVLLDGPYGHFHPGRFAEGTPLFLLSAGIGITPALALAGDEAIRARHPVTVIWSIKEPSEQSMAEPLKGLAESGAITLQTVFTREAPIGEVFGRLDEEALKPYVEGEPRGGWLLCGPPGFVKSMRKSLRSLGVPNRRILTERFSW